MTDHVFISYSSNDGDQLAARVAAALRGGERPCKVWVDRIDLLPGANYLAALDDAIKNCRCLVYLMTRDSTSNASFCLNEIELARRYRKPIVPVLTGRDVARPVSLMTTQSMDMTGAFPAGMEALRSHVLWIETEAGQLQTAQDHRDKLAHELGAPGADKKSIADELARVGKRIEELQRWLADPEGAKKQKADEIVTRLELERAKHIAPPRDSRRFINSMAFEPPLHFQDRKFETMRAVEFLRHPSLRLLTIVGRGGVGKTGMVCRLLKGIEAGALPDDLGQFPVAGIVYLSGQRGRPVSFPHLFEDLLKLLDPTSAGKADAIYREPMTSTSAKMMELLSLLPEPAALDKDGNPCGAGPIVVFLDNFEDLVDGGDRITNDRELLEALIAWLRAPMNKLKVILTTRVTPADLPLAVPAACVEVPLDKGLPPSAAVDLLRHLDHDGTVGLRSAAPEMLAAAADRVRGYPRALEALYAVLRNDRNTSLEELLGKADAALPEQVVQVMVGEAFSRLARHEQLIVTALAIFNRPVPAVALDYLLQPFAPAVESAPVLGWLVNLQMVRKDRDRYYLHQVDAEFARTGIPEAASPAVDDSGTTPLTRKALLVRAADYFREIRKPKAQWQSILDLEPQLAEFDLLCRAERYDDAALLLLAIGFDYLRSWGHISRLIESHERLRGRVQDEETESRCLGILGTAYWDAGYLAQAVADLRGSIALAERTQGENAAAAWWCDLGCCLRDLGRIEEAQAAHERALEVDHHFGDRSGVGSDLNNIAECYGDQGLTDLATRCIELGIEMIPLADVDDRRAIRMRGYRLATRAKFSLDARRWEQATESATEALRLGRQIGNSEVTARSSYYLALTSVSRGDLDAAKEAAKACIECEYPRLKFRALLLNGLIFLKLNEKREAEENFALCSRECAELLSRSEENYLARFHLALARCGLFVCGQTTDLQPAKDMLTGCTALKQYPGIRTRFLHLLRVMAAHDSTLELEDLALRIGGVAIGLPKPAAPVRSVLEHDAVRALRAALGPTRMSELYRHGFFEQCAEVAAGCEPVVNAMSVYQRREFLRARAWAQARRGFLDGAGFWTASKSGTTCHRCCG